MGLEELENMRYLDELFDEFDKKTREDSEKELQESGTTYQPVPRPCDADDDDSPVYGYTKGQWIAEGYDYFDTKTKSFSHKFFEQVKTHVAAFDYLDDNGDIQTLRLKFDTKAQEKFKDAYRQACFLPSRVKEEQDRKRASMRRSRKPFGNRDHRSPGFRGFGS